MDTERLKLMSLKDLNKRAEQTFEAIKQRKGWTERTLQEAAKEDSSIDAKKIQIMLNSTSAKRVELQDPVHHYDGKFDSAKVDPLAYIDSLELSANLAIAIACIVEYKSKGKRQSLTQAQEYIEKEIRNV
jgi:hypothetical protein